MIVVFGMAHSGTSIFTQILNQSPQIHLHTSGSQSWILECEEIAAHKKQWNASALKNKQKTLPKGEHLLVKRAWAESRPKFWENNFPSAYYFCLLRPFVPIYKSWIGATGSRPTIKNSSITSVAPAWKKYEKRLRFAVNFDLPNYMIVDHTRLCEWPENTFAEVAKFLKIGYTFDTSDIGNTNIKKELKEKKLKGKPQPPKFY